MNYSTRILSLIFLLVLLGVGIPAIGQNTVTIGGTDTRSDAVLWLVPNGNQGLILPVTQRAGFNPSEAGMMIYDPSANSVFFWNGSSWVDVSSGGGGNVQIQINGGNLELIDSGGGIISSIPVATFQDGTDDADNDPLNEIQNLSGVLTTGNDGGGLRITNIQDPTGNQDAATKAYVDNQISLIGSPLLNLNDLQDVSVSSASSGQVLQFNGTNWVPVTLPGGGDLLSANNLSDLADAPTARTNLGLGALAVLNSVSDTEITNLAPSKLLQEGAAAGEVLQWEWNQLGTRRITGWRRSAFDQ